MKSSDVAAELNRMLDEFLTASPAFPGVALAVRAAPLCWSGAAGFADRGSRTPLEVNNPFRIASVTKTFTAAAVLRLVEDGRLELKDSIATHLEPTTSEIVREGGYEITDIHVEQLLWHTSGLYDYAEDPEFQGRVVSDPGHRWMRAEQIRFAMKHGKPLSAPGEEYNYSDTGYVLLGEILERLTGDCLAAAYRTLLAFDRVGLTETYLETLEPTPPGLAARAHQYLGTVDSTDFDPSFDLYGGGGLVSTVNDLARFYSALFEGQIFTAPATLRTMLTSAPSLEGGMGISSLPLETERCWGEAGFWGVAVVHAPKAGVTIASTVNQANDFTSPTLKLHTDVLRLVTER